MKNPNFTDKELELIREIAIRLFLDNAANGKTPEKFQLQIISEAVLAYLKSKGRIK